MFLLEGVLPGFSEVFINKRVRNEASEHSGPWKGASETAAHFFMPGGYVCGLSPLPSVMGMKVKLP